MFQDRPLFFFFAKEGYRLQNLDVSVKFFVHPFLKWINDADDAYDDEDARHARAKVRRRLITETLAGDKKLLPRERGEMHFME